MGKLREQISIIKTEQRPNKAETQLRLSKRECCAARAGVSEGTWWDWSYKGLKIFNMLSAAGVKKHPLSDTDRNRKVNKASRKKQEVAGPFTPPALLTVSL